MRNFISFIIIASATMSTVLYTAEAGMPQLDPKYWASQAFWLILVFIILYFSIAKFYLPKIKSNLDDRENKIKEDLDNANKYQEQSEAKLEEYRNIIEDAKKEVSKIHLDSKNILDKNIKVKKENMEKEIENEISKAQKSIVELKKNSTSAIENISREIASNIIEKISGDKFNENSVKAAVSDVSKKNISKYL